MNMASPSLMECHHRETDKGDDDWSPYTDRVQFEVADFLFRRNQMSAGDINIITGLWSHQSLLPARFHPPRQPEVAEPEQKPYSYYDVVEM